MEVKHVPRIRLAPWRAPQQQRDLAIARGVLGQIVIDDQRMLAVVAEVLAHRGRRKRGEVLHRRWLGRGCRDHDRVVHRAVLLQRLHHAGHRGPLLPNGAVNADQIVLGRVDDRIQRHRGLAGLAIADDQLALPTADRDHRVDGLDAGGHRLGHRLPRDHARRNPLHR